MCTEKLANSLAFRSEIVSVENYHRSAKLIIVAYGYPCFCELGVDDALSMGSRIVAIVDEKAINEV